MSNGTSEQTASSDVGNTYNPKVEEPDTSLNPNIKTPKVLSDSLPEVRGQNPYYIKKKLLEDNKLFENVSRKMFVKTVGSDKLRQMEEEQFQNTYQTFKKNFRKDLVQTSYAGEDTDQTLVNRTIEFSDQPEEINTGQYASVLKKHQKKYAKSGLIDSEGNFLYEGDDTSFANVLTNDKKLYKQLAQDRYAEFESELNKYHNKVDGLENPSLKTKAWVVYDKQGPEGLTKLINGLQSETINDSFNVNNYLKRQKVGGKSLSDYYRNFVVGKIEGVKFGDEIAEVAYKEGVNPTLLTSIAEQESSFNPNAISRTGAVGITQLQPTTAREHGLKVPEKLYQLDKKRINSTGAERDKYERMLREATEQMEKDPSVDERYDLQKALTATSKYLKDSGKKFNNLDKTIASYYAGKRGIENVSDEVNWLQAAGSDTSDYVSGVKSKLAKYESKVDKGLTFKPRQPRKDLTKDIPKDLNRYNLQFYQKDGKTKNPKKTIPEFVEQVVPDTFREGMNLNKYYKLGDLSDEATAITKATYNEAMDGSKFGFGDLLNNLYANAESKGTTEFGQQYYQIDYDKLPWHVKNAYNALQMNPDTEGMFKSMGDGKFRVIPKRAKGQIDAVKKIKQFLFDTEKVVKRNSDGTAEVIERPEKGMFAQLWNSTVNLTLGGGHSAVKYIVNPLMQGLNNLTGGEYDFIRDSAEATEAYAGISLSSTTTSEEAGFLPNAAEEVAPFAWYMTAMLAGGGLIKSGIGKTMQLASRFKGATDAMRLGRILKGSNKVAAIGKAIEQSTNPAIKFYAGGAALESLSPKKDSFYNIIPQLAGKEDNPVTKFYNTADAWTRTAMDAAGSLALDFGIDTLIGASRFMKDTVANKFFDKNEFKSYQYVPEVTEKEVGDSITKELGGYYKTVDTPVFQHEIRTFYHQIMDDLAEKPIGNVGETFAKNLTADQTPETIHDMAYQFSEKLSPVANNMRKELRSHIEYLQKEFGNGVNLSDQQLDELVDQQYRNFINSSADNLYKVFKEGDGFTEKFSQALEKQLPLTKEFKVGGRRITPEEAPRWIDQGYNLVVKDGNVFEVDGKFWTMDLANALRKRDMQTSIDDIVARKAREEGIDRKNFNGDEGRYLQIQDEVKQTVGTSVDIDGQIGYIKDYDDEGFLVQTADGTRKVANVKRDLTEQELQDNFVKGLSKEFVRKRQGLGFTQPQQQRLLPAPSRQPDTPLRRTPQEIDQAERFGRQMLSTLDRPNQRLLTGRVLGFQEDERALLRQIESTEFQIKDLKRRHSLMDNIIDTSGQAGKTDEAARVGNMRRNMTRQMKELQEQRTNLQKQLSRFYMDNPQIQRSRVQDYVTSRRVNQLDESVLRMTQDKIKKFADELNGTAKTQFKLPYC